MQVFNPSSKDIDDLDLLGIAVKEVQVDQRHVGLLYQDGLHSTRMCHLAWHHDLRDQAAPADYFWVEVELDDLNKLVVIGFCLKVIEKNQRGQVPYGLTYLGDYFDRDTGHYQKRSAGDGLTCATFVMAIFDPLGLPILDVDTWQRRDGDAEWQNQIVAALQHGGASSEHIELVQNDIGCARFRPEEVAGSATDPDQPVPFDQAVSLGEELLRAMPRFLDKQ